LAYLKIEITKISDTQQEIIQLINNSSSITTTYNSWTGEIDYFMTAWPVSNHEELNDFEIKLQANEQDFKNKVVSKCYIILKVDSIHNSLFQKLLSYF